MDTMYMHDMAQAQLVAALWCSYDDAGNPLDANYLPENIEHDTRLRLAGEAVRFVALAAGYLTGVTAEQAGHDLWLTRNGHGTGFWDRGLGVAGDALTRLAESFGTVDLYITDDGQVAAI